MAIKRIERTGYLNRLIAWRDKHLIKIITGIRRCGKSTLMEIYPLDEDPEADYEGIRRVNAL